MQFIRGLMLFIYLTAITVQFVVSGSLNVQQQQQPQSYNYFYCYNKIYVDNNALSLTEIEHLCNTFELNDRYVIKITNIQNAVYDSNYFSQQAEMFFNQQCVYTPHKCQDSFGIIIFLTSLTGDKGTIRIVTGKNIKKIVSTKERQDVINNMIPKLQNKQYYNALDTAIKELNGYCNSSNGISFWKILLFILILCLIIGGIYYYYITQKATTTTTTANVMHQQQQSIKDEMLLPTSETIFNNNNNNSCNSSNNNNNSISVHLNYLISLLQQIKDANPPLLTIDHCLLCCKGIFCYRGNDQPQYIEMSKIIDNNYYTQQGNDMYTKPPVFDNVNSRFSCYHVYHVECLSKFNISYCPMCPTSLNTNIIVNNYNTQVVYEDHIRNLIFAFGKIYNKQALEEYINMYQSEFNSICGVLQVQLYQIWFNPNNNN